MSPGDNRWLVRLRDSGRVHPNPVFQQSYAFTVDSRGQTIDFLLSAKWDAAVAKRFFRKALGTYRFFRCGRDQALDFLEGQVLARQRSAWGTGRGGTVPF